jgi:hypothetical protein
MTTPICLVVLKGRKLLQHFCVNSLRSVSGSGIGLSSFLLAICTARELWLGR